MTDRTQQAGMAMWSVYVATTDGRTHLACGKCDWVHRLPTPFLLGDAVNLADKHRAECPTEVA